MQIISKHLCMIFKPMQAMQTPSLMWTPLAHVIVSIKVWFLSLNPKLTQTGCSDVCFGVSGDDFT
jgi:hypothetical protein